MKNLSKLSIITLFSIFALITFFPRRTEAVAISPPLYDYNLKPGQTITGEADVINNDDFSSIYEFKTVNIEYVGERAEPTFDINEKPAPNTLAAWIDVTPKITTVQAQTKIPLKFTVSVPENAPPGTHTAAIFITDPSVEKNDSESDVGIGKQLGLTFIVNVDGEKTQEPEFKDFDLVNGINIFGFRILNSLPANFETRLSNKGNTYYMPQGKVIIRDRNRTEIKKDINLNPNFNRVLPESTRLYSSQYLKDEESYYKYQDSRGQSLFKRIPKYLNYAISNLAIGFYNSELTVDARVEGDEQFVYGEQINFLVFPYKPIIIAIVLIAIGFGSKKAYGEIRGNAKRGKSRQN